jgi:hypothetical protein
MNGKIEKYKKTQDCDKNAIAKQLIAKYRKNRGMTI